MPRTLLPHRLLHRELGPEAVYTQPKGIYSDRKWVQDLDIVNELDGHSGCVNALSWSKSGRLLASGSDDMRLNIHTYLPDHTENPFALATTLSTGHSANIFSVKFMPHSNDRTLVSCAGDSEVRVFDIEHSSGTRVVDQGEGSLGNDTKHLSEADTNTRIFRSHSDRAKRIVTESSPFLFLSCSEDGEVRQWDIRQPSSTYPRPRGMSRYMDSQDTGDVPPPLISYKRYDLDLNTISCSPSQPHYIALGGAHLHCFLHDRRMTGRDILAEQGRTVKNGTNSIRDDELVSSATKCVKKFAPRGQQRMKKGETGHITACKISDANPNEMIVSWSGDWVYNFDIIRGPDAREVSAEGVAERRQKRARVREARNRKRKREAAGSSASLEGRARGSSKAKTEGEEYDPSRGSMALRVRYENGQMEDVPVADVSDHNEDTDTVDVAASQYDRKRRFKIAKTLVDIRKSIFSLDNEAMNEQGVTDPTGHGASFVKAMQQTLSILEKMDDIMRSWHYPVDPENGDVAFQNTLRKHRDRSRRFVQACGTISRILGGRTGTDLSASASTSIDKILYVQSSALERRLEDSSEQFCYDFLKAICLWLEAGPGALAMNFAGRRHRRPLPPDASIHDIDETLIPYLLDLASDRPIPDIDASPFEVNESRISFASEKAAVIAFASAIKVPFLDLSKAVVPADSIPADQRAAFEASPSQDRDVAARFWGLKIARGVLMNAGSGINFAFVERAFGGLGQTPRSIRQQEETLARQTQGIESDDDDQLVTSVDLRRGEPKSQSHTNEITESRDDRARRIHSKLTGQSSQSANRKHADRPQQQISEDTGGSDEDAPVIAVDDASAASRDIEEGSGHDADRIIGDDTSFANRNEEDNEEGETDDDLDMSSVSSKSEEDEDEDEDDPMSRNFLLRSAFARSSLRHKCNRDVFGVAPQLHYEGAANVRTVKDVNFYGLNDEYVVSGSDSGHFFIWDRASGQLLNILEGDGEVVNVIQGHPYEPMLAVSGIDHTVKIFSADKQARDNARKGLRINNTGYSRFSTLAGGGRTRFGRARRPPREMTHPEGEGEDEPLLSSSEPAVASHTNDSDTETEEAAIAPNGLSSRRRMHLRAQITSENDVERRGQGGRETFITRGMLAQLAARLRMRQRINVDGVDGDEGDEDDEGGDQVIEIDGDQLVIQGGGDCNVQ